MNSTAAVTLTVRSTDKKPLNTRFLGRQAIYRCDRSVYGHELLFRDNEVNAFSGDREEATRQVIENCLLLMPNKRRELCFVNCTCIALMSGIVTLLSSAETVLEILEDVSADPELLECCRLLKEQGYRFALDDFTPDCANTGFLEIADYIKVDFRATDAETRKAIYSLVDRSHQVCIAEKVETLDEVETARSEGCELFQGYAFSRPVITKVKMIPQQRTVLLRLLGALCREQADVFEVERIAKTDTAFCFQLLRLVNSALYHTAVPITSIRAAIMQVGMSEMRKLVLISMLSIKGDDSAMGLAVLALERARFCEQLGPFLRQDPASLYLLGMLSLLDVMLGVEMSEIVAALPLSSEMKEALLGTQNGMRTALDLWTYREKGEWSRATEHGMGHGIDEEIACKIHLESVVSAREIYQQMSCL